MTVTDELEKLWALGVRQITPIHGIDNGFGGAGFSFEAYSYAQHSYYDGERFRGR